MLGVGFVVLPWLGLRHNVMEVLLQMSTDFCVTKSVVLHQTIAVGPLHFWTNDSMLLTVTIRSVLVLDTRRRSTRGVLLAHCRPRDI
jgi:hypothetical protein